MAYTTYYWRNYNSSDTTRLTYTGDYVISVEDAGWEAPSGYVFSKWNSKRDGSGTSYSVGDASPQPWVVGDLYAIYSEIQVPEIDITYKGSSIATLSTNGTLTLETEGMYCEDDITVSYTRKNGSATTPETSYHPTINISVNQNGLVSANVDATEIITPTVVEGYVSSGTAGNIYINSNNNYQLTVQAAQTIHPSTSDQTIASGKYITGAQTVKGVLLTNLSAGNIKKDVVVKVGDSTDDDCLTSVTGTYEGGGSSSWHKLVDAQENYVSTTSTTAAAAFTIALGSSAYNYSQIIWVHIRDKAGPRNGYFYGSDTFFINSNATRLGKVRFSSPGVCRTTFTAAGGYETVGGSNYGVYGYSIDGDGTLTVNRRYSSSSSKTIDGTYVTNVYALDLPDNLTLFTNVF